MAFLSKDLESGFEKLSDYILSSVNDESWEKIVLQIFIKSEKSVGFNLDLYESENQKSIKLQNAFSAAQEVLQLRKITQENNFSKWNRAIFALMPNNKFEMEFIWDQELYDQVEFYNRGGVTEQWEQLMTEKESFIASGGTTEVWNGKIRTIISNMKA